jgi:hypothetical protein
MAVELKGGPLHTISSSTENRFQHLLKQVNHPVVKSKAPSLVHGNRHPKGCTSTTTKIRHACNLHLEDLDWLCWKTPERWPQGPDACNMI